MRRTTAALFASVALSAVAITASAASFRPDLALRAATATVARTLCDETFISGLDPEQSFKEIFTDFPGVSLVRSQMRHQVDRADRSVTVSLDGLFTSRAVFHDGYGCDLQFAGIPDRPIRATPARRRYRRDASRMSCGRERGVRPVRCH